jgi:hypothetical protein
MKIALVLVVTLLAMAPTFAQTVQQRNWANQGNGQQAYTNRGYNENAGQ